MYICLLSLHFAEYSYRLATALAQNNKVLLIVSWENFIKELEVSPKNIKMNNIQIVAIKHRKLKNPLMLLNVIKIVKTIRQFNPDIIHCQESFQDYQAMSLLFLRRFPFVLTIHDHVAHSGADAKLIKNSRFGFYRSIMRKYADAVIVHGDGIANETEALFPYLKSKVLVANHGVLGELPDTHSCDWEQGLLLFFGRIEEYKGLSYFLDALDVLTHRGVSVRGLVAGTGSDLDSKRRRIFEMDNCDLIEEYIQNNEIPVLFARSHIVVLPYTDATQSGVASFALQFGRPIIATRVGSLPEMVRDRYNGILIPPKDAMALASAIEEILNDRDLSIEMANGSRHLAETEYSWESISERTCSIYRTVLGGLSDV